MDKSNNIIIVIGEFDSEQNIATSTLENVTLGHKLSSEVHVVLGTNIFNKGLDQSRCAETLSEYGVTSVEFVDNADQLVGSGTGRAISKKSQALVDANKFVTVLGSQTYTSRDIAACLSVAIDCSVLANANNIEIDDGGIVTTHMVFGGTKIVKARLNNSKVAIVLLRPKSCTAEKSDGINCEVANTSGTSLIDDSQITKVISQDNSEAEGILLEDAKVVVSGGRGMGSAENYTKLVGALADLLQGATGATRAIVDAGWVPYSKQVGQTGKTVKPDVYFACGISGATQHQVGMKGSKKIIAINTDIDAPVFSISDIAIVSDVNTFLPKLIDAMKAKNS